LQKYLEATSFNLPSVTSLAPSSYHPLLPSAVFCKVFGKLYVHHKSTQTGAISF